MLGMPARASSRRTARDGAALVELVIMLPMLSFILVASADFGRAFHDLVTITDCARNGALYASRNPGQSPSTYQAGINSAALADAAWSVARVGWGRVARNSFRTDDPSSPGLFLQLGGRVYDHGLYAHSPALYAFALDGTWRTFRSTVGLRDGAAPQGSAIFTVVGDGRELCRSRPLRAGDREDLVADVAGVNRLELRTEGAEGHNHNSWAVWVGPTGSR